MKTCRKCGVENPTWEKCQEGGAHELESHASNPDAVVDVAGYIRRELVRDIRRRHEEDMAELEQDVAALEEHDRQSSGGFLVPQEFVRDRWVDVTPWWLRPLVKLGVMGPVLEHAPGILTLMARPVGCRFPMDCAHPQCGCLPWADPTEEEEQETPLADFREALAGLADAVTEALRIPQLLDWLGERLDAIRLW